MRPAEAYQEKRIMPRGKAEANAIVERGLSVAGFSLSRSGAVARADATFEEWRQLGLWLRHCEGALHFWIGDWLNLGERRWGEKYTEAIEQTGFEYGTVRNAKYVAGRIEVSRRRDSLSWSHHYEVAAL